MGGLKILFLQPSGLCTIYNLTFSMLYKLRFPFSGPWQEFNNWVERATWILPHPQSAHQKCSNLVQRKVHLSKRIRNIQKRDKKMLLKVKTSKTWGGKIQPIFFSFVTTSFKNLYLFHDIWGAQYYQSGKNSKLHLIEYLNWS